MRDRDDDDRYEDDRDDDRPRRSRSRYDDDDRERLVPYPSQLRTAGYLWVGFGILILLGGAYALMTGMKQRADGDAAVIGGTCGVLLVALFGGVFIHVGVQSINGTARDTMGNGIGSLVFAALQFGAGALQLRFEMIDRAVISFACGGGLLVAGVMAILARADYLDWKKQNKSAGGSDSYFGKRRRDDD